MYKPFNIVSCTDEYSCGAPVSWPDSCPKNILKNNPFSLDKRISVLYLCNSVNLKTHSAMDNYLSQAYLEVIRNNVERIAQLEREVDGLKTNMKIMGEKLQAEIDSLKEELRSRGKVYIGEMHGTIEGDAYQRKTS